MNKFWQLDSKYNYWQFLILFIAISFLIIIFLVNPNSLSSSNFNDSYTTDFENGNLDSFIEQYNFIKYNVVDNIPERVLDMKNEGKINISQMDLILSERNEAKDYLYAYNQGKEMQNFQNALFHSQLSYGYIETFPTINCANDVEELSKKYVPLFFYLSYSDKEKILNILSVRERAYNYLGFSERYTEDFDWILSQAKGTFNIKRSLEISKLDCGNFKKYLEEDYNRQRSWLIFKTLALIFAVLIGIFLEAIFKGLRKVDKKGEDVIKRVHDFFLPKEVQKKSVERIIKTNSIIAVFGALTFGFMNLNDPLFKILGIIAFLDVLIILSSIVFGISALNNGSEKTKKLCYSLYLLGIFTFIGVIIFLFIILFLTGFGSIIKESTQTFLNNGTIH